VGIDPAKNVFAVTVADGDWRVVERARLSRAERSASAGSPIARWAGSSWMTPAVVALLVVGAVLSPGRSVERITASVGPGHRDGYVPAAGSSLSFCSTKFCRTI
jgi:hypothetical protein